MTLVRAQVNLPYATGLPEDVVVNTLYFDTGANPLNNAMGTEITLRLGAAYSQIAPYLSAYLSRATGAVQVKLFDMATSEPRAPFNPGWAFTLPAASTNTSLPLEIALCLSYTSSTNAGTTARNRGRVYLGPWVSTQSSGGTGGTVPRPNQALIDELIDFGESLDTTIAESAVGWRQYSPTGGVNGPVTRIWVDNEFDIQRRRGVKATARTEATL